MNNPVLRLVVFASGNGTNLQRIIDLAQSGELSVNIVAVVSDKENAFALKRAEKYQIKTIFIDPQNYNNRLEFDDAVHRQIEPLRPDLIVLAGFMRILSAQFVNRYENRILNIHPSLLPKFKGTDTHRRVLEQGEKYHGATVHFVTPELDAGPIILQKKFEILATDTVESLEERVHHCEYEIYPRAIAWFCENRIYRKDA